MVAHVPFARPWGCDLPLSATILREGEVMVTFKGTPFEGILILTSARWSVASPVSAWQPEELMQERGVAVDHATMHRWLPKYGLQLASRGAGPAQRPARGDAPRSPPPTDTQ
jgi:hypothetical protein